MELDTSESELRWNTVAQVIGQPVYPTVIKKVLDESSWDTVVRMTMLDSKTMEMKTLLMVAAHTAQCDLATQLIEHGADVYHHVNGNSVLSYAIRSCSPDMVTLMIKHGCPLNTVDNNGNSALCLACWIGALPVARVLISNGAAVNIANTDGLTPVMLAAAGGYGKLVQFLVDCDADLSNISNGGKTAFQLAANAETRDILTVCSTTPESWLAEMLRARGGVAEHFIRQCERILVKQEGFVSAAILQNVPKSVFTTTYLSGVGITARGLQQCLIGLQGDLVHAYTPPPSSSPPLQAVLATPAAAAAVAEGDTGSCCKRETLDGIEPTTHRTWLGVKLATFGMSAERIAHCEQVLVQNEGFTTQKLLKGCAKSSTLTCSYLKSIGITGLGTQQIVFDATFQ